MRPMNGWMKFWVGLILAIMVLMVQAAAVVTIAVAGFTVTDSTPVILRAFLALGAIGWWLVLDPHSGRLIDKIKGWAV